MLLPFDEQQPSRFLQEDDSENASICGMDLPSTVLLTAEECLS